MGTIELKCGYCKELFQKATNEYNRQIKNGRKPDCFFCSSSCSNKKAHQDGVYDYEKLNQNSPRGYDKSDEYTPFRWFVLRAKHRAKKKLKKECGVTVQYLKKLYENQNGICPLTGWKLVLPTSTNGWERVSIKNASLDRINNDKGYVEGNVRFISRMANMARQTYSDDDVIEFCQAVVDNVKN